jgi:ABC-type Fe3+ transport system permease subunit
MSLADYLKKIQDKPRPVRVAIMWVGVAIFMTLFLILWAVTINSGQNNENLANENQFSEPTQSFSEAKEDIPSLWQSLKASVSGLFESVNEAVQSEPKVQIEGGGQEINSNDIVPPASLP